MRRRDGGEINVRRRPTSNKGSLQAMLEPETKSDRGRVRETEDKDVEMD